MRHPLLNLVSIISGAVLGVMLVWGMLRFLRRNPRIIRSTAVRIWENGCSAFSAPDATVKDWDQSDLLHRVTGGLFRFLIAEHFILWITVSLAQGGFSRLFMIESFLCAGMYPIMALRSGLGIIGSLIFVAATFHGIRQDHHRGRFQALAVVALSGVMMGLGLRCW